jgi:hypothetical protein
VTFEDASLADADLQSSNGEISRLYASLIALRDPNRRPSVSTMGDAAASKILHILIPRFFVMWDKEIKKAIPDYGRFMIEMQMFAQRIRETLAPAEARADLDGYLQQLLRYPVRKPLAKYIDEYNWWVAWAQLGF